MHQLSMLQRLCWKEFRQGWVMLVIGLLLPPLAVMLDLHRIRPFRLEMPYLALFLLLVGVSVWAASLAHGTRARQSYSAIHFSQHPALAAVVSFLFHGAIALMIGLNVGWWSRPPMPLLGILLIVSTFGMSFAVTLALTQWAGVVAGVAWLAFNTTIFEALSMPTSSRYTGQIHEAILYRGLAVAAFLLAITILLLPTRPSFQVRRVLACLVLVAAVLVQPVVGYIDGYIKYRQHGPLVHIYPAPIRLCSTDGSLAVEAIDEKLWNQPTTELRFVDYRRNRISSKVFTRCVQPVGFVGRDTAILLQQQPEERQITVLRWRLGNNSIERVVSFHARRKALKEAVSRRRWYLYAGKIGLAFAQISTDERSLIVILQSGYGFEEFSSDLWRIDLLHDKAIMLQPSIWIVEQYVSWADHDAILSGNTPFRVLPSGKVVPFKLPNPEEKDR